MECQHPYVVFKDIDAVEMELLLSYMYQGEINVVQEKLPYLFKAAEALKIKGLAVPDDLPLDEEQLERTLTCSEVDESSGSRKVYSMKEKKYDSKDEEGYKNTPAENSLGFSISSVVNENIENKESNTSSEESVKPEPVEIGHYRNLAHVVQATNNANPLSDSMHKPDAVISNNNAGCSYMNTTVTSGADNVFSAEQTATPVWTDFQQQIIESFPKSERPADIQCIPHQEHVSNYQQRNKFMVPSTTQQEKQEARYDAYGNATNKLTHVCAYCPYKSYDKSRVTTHTRFKHTRERPFACSYCPKRFVTKLILNRHMQTHTGEKQFQCTHCSFKCIQKVHLQKHMLLHTGEKKVYQCEHCSRTFSQLASYKRHQNSEIKCYENAA